MLYCLIAIGSQINYINEFNKFILKFNKTYKDDDSFQQAYKHFSINYQHMLNLTQNDQCPHCKTSGIMDQDLSHLRAYLNSYIGKMQQPKRVKFDPHTPSSSLFEDQIDCQVFPCAIELKFDESARIYNEIDLREVGLMTTVKQQGNCGACWCFSTVTIMEAAILSDQNRGLGMDKPFWAFNAKNLSLSEQFTMSNLWGFQQYCDGGNFITAIAGITENFSTIEFETNFPYEYQSFYSKWQLNQPIQPKIDKKDFYIPIQKFKQDMNINISGVYIYFGDSSIFTNKKAVIQAKQMLSRGIPLAAVMQAEQNLQYYDGTTIIKGNCNENQINHQVTITGYGKKDGQYVWVVRNSWSSAWGSDGYFYIRQGYNDYCIETTLYTAFPARFNLSNFANELINKESIKQINRGQSIYLDQQIPQIVDSSEAYNIFGGFSVQTIIIAVTATMCILIMGGIGIYLLIRGCKNRRNRAETQILDSKPQYGST